MMKSIFASTTAMKEKGSFNLDKLVKSLKKCFFVIPVETGIVRP